MRYAALDVGTNSVQLLIAEEAAEGAPMPVLELFAVPRLGEGTSKSGVLKDEAIRRTLDTVESLLRRGAAAFPGAAGTAAGTSALREATNATRFLVPFRERFGFDLPVLSGEEEALTTFRGAVSDLAPGVRAITVDTGGGSTEIGFGDSAGPVFAESITLGCVSLSERFRLADRVSREDAAAALGEAVAALAPVASRLLDAITPGSPLPRLVFSGGSATTYAAAALGLDTYEADRVHGFAVPVSDFVAFVDRLLGMSAAERAELPCVPPDRAEVLAGGLLIVRACLEAFPHAGWQVTTYGLRRGLILRLAAGELPPLWPGSPLAAG